MMGRLLIVSLLLFLKITFALSQDDYDFIVVGSGAGSIVAARLSENEKFSVLLLEAGGVPPKFTDIPYMCPGPHAGDFDWNFLSEKQEHASLGLIDQKWVLPRGKVLGGSTILNSMVYTRGNPKDYDIWEELGNKGWNFESVLKYYKKLEDYQIPVKEGEEDHYGKGGPVTISQPPYKTAFADAFLEAGIEMGYEVIELNGKKQTGFGSPPFNLRNSTRWSTYSAYLKPALHRRNLHVITNAFVTKVLFDESKRAIGVVYDKDSETVIVKARNEIIVSAGALSSPPLLMWSGVGPKETLEKQNIQIVADLPGVGQNLIDHISVAGVTFTVDFDFGLNSVLRSDVNAETMELWETKRQGPLTVPHRGEGISFMNTKYANPDEDFPDIELQAFHNPPSRLQMPTEVYESAFGHVRGATSMMSVHPIVQRPKSVGYISIRSSDPYDPPIIQPNYLSDPYDVAVLVEGVKFSLDLMKTEALKKFGIRWHGRKFPKCEHLPELSDEYLECFVRHYSFGMYHQSGTCKMGPSTEKMAVVDERLRVYGVKGLRVIDMSIAPTIVTAHTMAPALMIGEKGADMIIEDWSGK